MIFQGLFKSTPDERAKTIKRLIDGSYPGPHFFALLIASAVIATGGLILDNSAVIIGSMLVAPFLAPVLSVSLGIAMADFSLIRRSLVIIAKAILVAIAAALIFALFLSVPAEYNTEILSRGLPSFPYLYIAIAAGAAASFAVAKPPLAEFVVGVAVSVALLPPLAVTGIGIGTFHSGLAGGAFQLFAVNLIGVIFAGIIVFSLMGYYPSRAKADQAIKVEEKKLESEKKASG